MYILLEYFPLFKQVEEAYYISMLSGYHCLSIFLHIALEFG
jgi:hypothetical protein